MDINVEPAWEDGVLGEGVNIAVVDQGMDVGHEDLKDNVDIRLNYDSNLDEYVNYHGVTAACSVQGRGARAPYSEMGANLWVCAPSNERPGVFGLGGRFGIVTTENSDNYARDFGGTSAAASVVSGVAALMRSANPDLTWRDLKLILAASAQKNDPDNAGWEEGARKYRATSAAERYHFNHEYGFGLADAGATVAMAKQWVNVPELRRGGAGSGKLDTPIPDASVDGHSTTTTSSITLEKSIGFTEFGEVNVSLRHESFRDLEIELVSPSGAISRLSVPHDTYSDIYSYLDFVPLYGSFRFGSARHPGEDPNGDWTLRVTDRIHARDGILESWNISVYGHMPKPDAPTVESLTPGPGSLTVVSLGEIGDRYDADSNEVIHRDEVILAIQDYLDGQITRDEVIAVIRLYLGF